MKRRIFIKNVSKYLQNNTPKSELWFYEILKNEGMEGFFLKNVPIHRGIPDLVSKELRIIIEIDGSIHSTAKVKKKDARRQLEYEQNGYDVFRIEHGDVDSAKQLLLKLKDIIENKPDGYVTNKLRRIKDEKQGASRPDPINKQLESIAKIMATDTKRRPKKIR